MHNWAIMISLRRSTRSASTPAQGPISNTGSVRTPITVPVSNALLSVSLRTSQPTVRICIHWAL